ncbi:hypothetical protein [Limnoglobus roseus]|uniref:Uncharacterized protein n=1 Tax=Limnoglobus roseus TaxID=2598579 RepID=A0A5C1A9V1_9BACT|nr:hypothetical protein [Limnoglobus roseus]QEL14997.1 hypothetical protein PX52LOC_01902 [Limnoglobus roseus]
MHTKTTTALATFDDLVHYVRATLCQRDNLDYDLTPFVRTPLKRRDELWGYAFHVEGPRMLRTSAVWSAKDDKILFYNSVGERFHDVHLTESPDLVVHEPAGN